MRVPKALTRAQDRLARFLGCEPEERVTVVQKMLARSPHESTGYWLQLVVAVGIATLGLVLGSTAVVIAGMLVAPLMVPIVGLGMGLATGSPFLVVRGAARVGISVAVAMALSAAIARLLPFHDINDEISARVSPTALDLATAVFCAIAGVYASMRPSSDVATTAAGTSIGISLVPPLCVSGYGLGTAGWPIAGGAALLFLTNFVAILVVSTSAFALAGFGQVDFGRLEREDAVHNGAPLSRAVAGVLSNVFASRGGPWLRIVMPLVLLAALYVPLRRGLDEVAWQIRARDAVDQAVSALPHRVVESRVRIERNTISLVIFLLGDNDEAVAARRELSGNVSRRAGVVPSVEVYAVADAAAFEAIERTLRTPPPAASALPSSSKTIPTADITLAHRRVQQAVDAIWPRASTGTLIAVELSARSELVQLHVVHLGDPLNRATEEALERSLADDLDTNVAIASDALPSREQPLTDDEGTELVDFSSMLRLARRLQVAVCLVEPQPPKSALAQRRHARLRSELDTQLAGQPRLTRAIGDHWSIRFSADACKPEDGR